MREQQEKRSWCGCAYNCTDDDAVGEDEKVWGNDRRAKEDGKECNSCIVKKDEEKEGEKPLGGNNTLEVVKKWCKIRERKGRKHYSEEE